MTVSDGGRSEVMVTSMEIRYIGQEYQLGMLGRHIYQAYLPDMPVMNIGQAYLSGILARHVGQTYWSYIFA